MTAPDNTTPDGSTRVGNDSTVGGRHATEASGTHAGADMHNRMTGTDRTAGTEHTRQESFTTAEHRIVPEKLKPAKTSAAATFGLVFGLAALFCALTGILSPAAVLFGLIGIILSIAGMKMAKKLGVTGKGVAIGGLVTSILGLVLGAAVLAGLAALANDDAQLDRLQQFIDDARQDAPSTQDLREELPN